MHFFDKVFYNETVLPVHMKTHTGEKPFKCTNCHNASSNKNYLSKHVWCKYNDTCSMDSELMKHTGMHTTEDLWIHVRIKIVSII